MRAVFFSLILIPFPTANRTFHPNLVLRLSARLTPLIEGMKQPRACFIFLRDDFSSQMSTLDEFGVKSWAR